MNVGKTLFTQIMELVPWMSFTRIVERYFGNARVRRMTCAEQFRVMAYAQLTCRESLRDIEVMLGANANKLYSMGLGHAIHRSTLSDANELRNWRIWADLAAVLIRRARKLYRDKDFGLDLSNTGYALDATTIDLYLSLFDWAPFRSTKAAIKMHTLLDLRGAIPTFLFARLYQMDQARTFFVTRAKRGMDTQRVYSTATDRATGVMCDHRFALNGFYTAKDYPAHLRRIRVKDPDSGKTFVFLTNNMLVPPLSIAALCKSRWQGELFFKWIKQHLRIKKFLGTSENTVKTQTRCAVSTYVLIAIVKKELQFDASLYALLQILSVPFSRKPRFPAPHGSIHRLEKCPSTLTS